MIDIERLGILLDRGEAVRAAAVQMRTTLNEKEAEMREARVDLEQAEAAVTHYSGPESGMATLVTRVNTKRAKCDALAASIARQRTANTEIAQRVQLWAPYCDALRTLAKKHGVEL